MTDGSDANGKSFQLFLFAPPTVTWANNCYWNFEKIVEIKNPNLFQDRDLSWPTRASFDFAQDKLLAPQEFSENKNPSLFQGWDSIFVGPLGLEPRLFCTKNRRVASYTMGQFQKNLGFRPPKLKIFFRLGGANLIQTLACTNILIKKYCLCFANLHPPKNIAPYCTLPQLDTWGYLYY